MFDSKKKISSRLTDATDLLIDFATLGEYGLEPAGEGSRACESRQRPRTPQQESFSEVLFPNRHACGAGQDAAGRRSARVSGRSRAAL